MENLATFENPVFGIKHALKTSRRVEQREKRKREKRSKDRTRFRLQREILANPGRYKIKEIEINT